MRWKPSRHCVINSLRSPSPCTDQQAPRILPLLLVLTSRRMGCCHCFLQARANRDTSVAAATRPDWVNAASLQVALKGASSAVPHLQVRGFGWRLCVLQQCSCVLQQCSWNKTGEHCKE